MKPTTDNAAKDTLLHVYIRGLLADIADPELFTQWEASKAGWTRHEKVLFHSRLQARKHEQETEPQTK